MMKISVELKLTIINSWYNKTHIYLENLSDILLEECENWARYRSDRQHICNYKPYEYKIDVKPFYGIWPVFIDYKRKRVGLMYDLLGEKNWSDWFCLSEEN